MWWQKIHSRLSPLRAEYPIPGGTLPILDYNLLGQLLQVDIIVLSIVHLQHFLCGAHAEIINSSVVPYLRLWPVHVPILIASRRLSINL